MQEERGYLVVTLVARPVQGGRAFVVQLLHGHSHRLEVQEREGLSRLGGNVHYGEALVVGHFPVGLVFREGQDETLG